VVLGLNVSVFTWFGGLLGVILVVGCGIVLCYGHCSVACVSVFWWGEVHWLVLSLFNCCDVWCFVCGCVLWWLSNTGLVLFLLYVDCMTTLSLSLVV